MGSPVLTSVVIATRDRAQLLARTLDALLAQSDPPGGFEIIVADNGSTDDTRAVVEHTAARNEPAPVRYLHVPQPGKSYAVNEALQHAEGRIIAFTDDDVVPDRDWLVRISRAFEQPNVAFVAGRVLPLWESSPPPWMSPALHGVLAIPDNGEQALTLAQGKDTVVPIGANMAVRRDVIDRVGGLRVDLGKLSGSLRTGEDHEFYLRMLHAGYEGVYDPRALVHHFVPRHRLERRYFRRWLFQNGHDVAKLERSYPSPATRLFGVPRYLWRQGLGDLWTVVASTLRRDEGARFAAEVRLTWLGGYARESWFRPAS